MFISNTCFSYYYDSTISLKSPGSCTNKKTPKYNHHMQEVLVLIQSYANTMPLFLPHNNRAHSFIGVSSFIQSFIYDTPQK